MGFWVFVALAVAVLALRRVLKLEGVVRELRGEIVTLHGRLSALRDTRPEPVADTPAPLVTFEETAPVVAVTVVETTTIETTVIEPAAATPPPSLTEEPTAPPPPPMPPPAPVVSADDDSLERQIGSKWLLYFGIAALVLGVSYFIKYAFDNEWIAPPVRVALGIAGGAALVWAGQLFVGRGLERYGQTLTGGGFGILYLAIYTAHQWYGLIGRGAAFTAMVVITLAGVAFADRQRSQILALFAVTIGFLTPFLVGGDSTSPVTLFTYDLVLVVGTLLLARRRDWPALNIVSYMATAMTISTWAEAHYRRTDYLTVELFLTAFLALFLLVWRENRKSTSAIAPLGSVLLASAPVFYHLASLSVLGPHRGPLLVYFIGFSVAGVIASQHLRTAWLRLIVWFAIALPFLGFASTRLPRGWVVAAWVTLAAIYGLHLIAQAQALDDERERVPAPEVLLLHANALWALTVIWLLLAPQSIAGLAPAALAFALLYAGLAFLARHWHRAAAIHGATLALTLAASASAMWFDRAWMSPAFAVEGAALTWLGLRERRPWVRHGGSAFLSLATALLLVELVAPIGVASLPFANTRGAAAAALIALMAVSAWWTHRLADPPGALRFAVARLVIVANVLTVVALSAEISACFGLTLLGEGLPGASAWSASELSRQLTLSITWAAYALVLVAVGLRRDYRPVRVLAIGLFAITILKVFFVDLAELDRVSRMLSVIGLGVLLLAASYLYQRLSRTIPPEPVQS